MALLTTARGYYREIATGERLQQLAAISLVPQHVRTFHRHVERYASEMLLFDRYSDLDDRAIARLSKHRSLFVYTHELQAFIQHVWPRLDGRSYVLITHNSDVEIGQDEVAWLDGTGSRITHWFAQNVTVAHPRLAPLPIGIANRMWPHGNVRVLARAMTRARGKDKDRLVFVHFNTATHARRAPIWDALRTNFPGLPSSPPPSRRFADYLGHLAAHHYCVCPRGNGIDTHRLWECVYLGVIPIVERTTHVELWARAGVPLLIVEDWSDVTAELLRSELPRLAAATVELPAVALMSYHAERVSAAINATLP